MCAPAWQFLRVTTDAGVEGWSEAVVEGNVRAVRGAVESLAEYIVGRNPRDVATTGTRMYTDNFLQGRPRF